MSEKANVNTMEIKNIMSKLIEDEKVKRALELFEIYHEDTIKEQIEICEIPAPPFHEEVRGRELLKRFTNLGLEDVKMDSVGNVLAKIRGEGEGPTLVVSAHQDTVFPPGTDTTVVEKDGILYAPGIGDDTRGLAELLVVARIMKEVSMDIKGEVLFCATVGEEGEGDLRGVKQLFKENSNINAFISLDGNGVESITYLAKGSKRYKVSYKGPGGHSSGDFGNPSAIHAMGRAIDQISNIEVDDKSTTYTVGTVEGGTSINAIAATASMKIDMRSGDKDQLADLESNVLKILEESIAAENDFWNSSNRVTVSIDLIGNRPTGSQLEDSILVQTAIESIKAIGYEPKLEEAGSTDSNLPISLNIPAITLGRGGSGDRRHSLEEWFDPRDAYLAPQRVFLMILSLVGVNGLCNPILDVRK